MSLFGEPSEADRRRWRVQEFVRSLAVSWFGTREVREPIGATSATRLVLADPLEGLRAAVTIRRIVVGQECQYACDARAAGWSWAEIGRVLGFDDAEEPDLAGFEHVVARGGRRRPYRDSVSWRCSSCGSRVTDTGPYGSHPTDVEHGHADGCARHRADITAWEQRTGWAD
ncbi:hypothetical protein [Pseudonocardia alni]|uniref:hypothetical protein n=1 Tax=Pseudonocardia alni TaxID=33907 RepID=UPI00280B4FF3|nr:hypothetical protein [Pseudonocardia alni]